MKNWQFGLIMFTVVTAPQITAERSLAYSLLWFVYMLYSMYHEEWKKGPAA